MIKLKCIFSALAFLLFFSACDSHATSPMVTLENLQVQYTVVGANESNPNGDGSGKVEVTAFEKNAVRYAFKFDNGNLIESESGSVDFTFSKEGLHDYTVVVWAYAASGQFVNKTNTLSVFKTIQDNEPLDLPTEGYTTPLSYEGYQLVWQDEFEGNNLSADWKYEIGTGSNGWGNEELQYYREENTSVQEGLLVIEAKKEAFSGQQYTSSRLVTEGNRSFRYGRIDIRAVLPEGQGIWPALWMLGSNFSEVGWPYCGEIDIMEMVGGGANDSKVYGTLHWDNNGSYACTCDQGNMFDLGTEKFSEKFHVFSIIWDAQQIQWYVDDNLFKTVSITPADLSEFQAPFFFIFNVAVGGKWPGNPDASTVFPQKMAVDYVRVFQK